MLQAVSSWGTSPPPPRSAATAADIAFYNAAFGVMVVLSYLDAVQLTGMPQQDSDALALLAACLDALKQHKIVLLATSTLNIVAGVQQQHKQQQAAVSSARGGSSHRRGSAVAHVSAATAAPSTMQHSAALGALLVHNRNHAAVLLTLLQQVVRLTSQHMQEPAKRPMRVVASQLFGQQATDLSYWRAVASVLRLLCIPTLGGAQPVEPTSGGSADVQHLLGHAPAFPSDSSGGGGGGGSTNSSSAWASANGSAADRELTARWQSLLDGSRTPTAPNVGKSRFKLHDQPRRPAPQRLQPARIVLCGLAGWLAALPG